MECQENYEIYYWEKIGLGKEYLKEDNTDIMS